MNYSNKFGLQPADRIIEPIFQTGIAKHHAIYLGRDYNGVEWIAENYKFKGVRLIKASDYFTKGKLIKVKKFVGNYQQRITAVKRAMSLMGARYDLIDFNCEHYAEYVQTGKAKSMQIDNLVGAIKTAVAAVVIIGVLDLLINE